mmetsp:Transcript_112535/g.218056  ORF Transcript_112535/g.218056 Transcript_112535/m.218056 type:complete len:278 (+) Transcript_112535:143-976(+)
MAASVESIMQDVAAWLKGVAGAMAPKTFIVAPGDAAGGIEVGDLEELTTGSGEVKPVRVIAVDTISYPPRVRVNMVDAEGQTTDEILVVPVLQQEDVERIQHGSKVMVDAGKTTVYQDYEDAFTLHNDTEDAFTLHNDAVQEHQLSDEGDCDEGDCAANSPMQKRTSGVARLLSPGAQVGQAILQGVSQEWQNTVLDVREKGPVVALFDAALDAVDCVGDAAGIAADTARAIMKERSEGALADDADASTEKQLATPIVAKLPSGITVTLGPQAAQQH